VLVRAKEDLMSAIDDVCRLSASELARRIATREVSAVEAVEAHIARIEEVNATLNAVVVKRYDAARAEAREIDARRARGETLPPLAGVPVTIKECLDVEGTPSTCGIPSRIGHRAMTDDVHVGHLRAAGAIVLGKTNAAQLLIFTETDNPLYGRTNNPWNPDRSCGGSSGGEGAIVAAGGSALGLGTDIGGSIRIPACFCGVSALRPTAGRLPDQGRLSVPIGQQAVASQVGPIARRVEDLALALQVLSRGGGPTLAPPMPLQDFRTVDVARLRVGVFHDDGVLTPAPAARRGVEEAARMLFDAGAEVAPWQPPPVAMAMALWLGCLSADGGRGMKRLVRGQKLDKRAALFLSLSAMPSMVRSIVAPVLEALGQRSMGKTLRLFRPADADHHWRTVEAVIDYRRLFHDAMDRGDDGGPIDLVLCPAYGVPAVRHGASADLPVAGAYTLLAPVLGFPSGTVPVTRVSPQEETARPATRDRVEKTARLSEQGSAGLPVGVQIISRPWQEHVALAAMQAIETAACRQTSYPHTPLTVP
jgi:Asp-tRNA(Asn)/Glu-tRNA(Gln) amidotransferase A subunit family amidase